MHEEKDHHMKNLQEDEEDVEEGQKTSIDQPIYIRE